MFFKKPSPTPRGVPLGDLEEALKQTTLKSSRNGDTLVVKHERPSVKEGAAGRCGGHF